MSGIAPLNGRLSHVFSPRYCIFCSALITTLGALITSSAHSLVTFLIGRAITGTGAAGIFTVSIILVVQLTTPKRRGLFNGLLNSGYTIGVAAGAVVAGAIEPAIGWRALFWLQAPIAALAGLTLVLTIPSSISANSVEEQKAVQDTPLLTKLARIDYLGAALLVSSIVSLLYGLSTPRVSPTPIIIFAILFPLFLYREVDQAADPIIPLSVLRSRGALLSCLATLGFMTSRWTVLFYTPIYATAVRGWAPATAGSILIPTNTGFALGGLIPGFFHIRRAGSFWGSCVFVFALFPITIAALATLSTPVSPVALYVLATFANGACAGAALNYTLVHALHLVRPDIRFIVTSLLATFRGFAGTFGSAVGGGIFARVLQRSLEEGFRLHGGIKGKAPLIRELLGSPRAVQRLVGIEREVAVNAYVDGLRTLFLSAVGLACLMWFVQAGTGWNGPEDEAKAENDEQAVGVEDYRDDGRQDLLERSSGSAERMANGRIDR